MKSLKRINIAHSISIFAMLILWTLIANAKNSVIQDSVFQNEKDEKFTSFDSLFLELGSLDGLNYDCSSQLLRCDTTRPISSVIKIVTEFTDVKQITTYKGVNKKGLLMSASDRSSEIIFKNGYSFKDMYYRNIEAPECNKLEYNGKTFSYFTLSLDPERELTAYATLNVTYLIFDQSTTKPYELVQIYDSFGLRFADVNHDGILEFFNINPLFDIQDVKKLSKQNRNKYNKCEDPRGVYYIIKPFRYINGVIEYIKASNSEEMCVIIRFARSFLEYDKVEIIYRNW